MAEKNTLTLTEFLLARIAEDEERRLAAASEGMPREVFEKTTLSAFMRLGFAANRVGLTMPVLQKTRALKWAHHPDYRDEWRP